MSLLERFASYRDVMSLDRDELAAILLVELRRAIEQKPGALFRVDGEAVSCLWQGAFPLMCSCTPFRSSRSRKRGQLKRGN